VTASTSHDASHLSIGEVLNILREEFPDITISKIRFLESQGLIDPERTPSGYRKFYGGDVARLRWILHQQKENFLPLKVIKERLAHLTDSAPPAPVSSIASGSDPVSGARRRSRRSTPSDPDVAPTLPFDEATPAPPEKPAKEPNTSRNKLGRTRAELLHSVGLEDWLLAELESFGLLRARTNENDDEYFDDEAHAIATAAAGFYAHGIGPRHLRMYKHFAEREAALFTQVSMHYLRQRNPEARSKAQEELAALSRLGRALRAALLVQAVRESLTE
jgi:DNA-binding transcriptional MerR regulator